ncbi:Uma2 family endonuclease [Carbonactinospora thermoautotrophica]|uniref:Uma2 family endonuclease n=1 Tax=Carbonactinospora thermoautotrophica TaxID=1469144 RepID=UPI002270889C|nr:Uma2 family endonuclease [Carbonactinospora thermoautotrophica]MCX9190928.1 Uma2 family endonuclease [Carbonactinospora thermoautotrophica]
MTVALEHPGPWTAEDVLAMPEDPTHARYEVIDGGLIVTPAPGFPHQRASFRLHVLLAEAAQAAGADVEVIENVNVLLPAGLTVPDVVVVDAEVARRAGAAVDASAVQAVVEIVSPSTQRMDRLVKPGVYAEAGIPVLWRVELEPVPAVIVSELRDGRYVESAVARAGQPATIPVPFPVKLDPRDLVLV